MEKPAKKARRCVQCGSAETPQWRSGPMGTLCNACGVRLRAAGALRETEHRPPPEKARKAAEPPPPASPASDSPSDSPIREHRAPLGDVYLVRKQPKRGERRTPRKEAAPAPKIYRRTPRKGAAPAPAPAPDIYLVKKKKPSKKPWRPRNTGRSCQHCGSTSTPQWREGPMGRHTLCNACGVRYRQGRLLPEYRPASSPTFVPSEHSSRHRDVIQLHRQRQTTTNKQHTKKPKPANDPPDRRVGGTGDAGAGSDDENRDVFLMRRQWSDKEESPPTPVHRPLPYPYPAEADPPRDGGGSGDNDPAAGSSGGGDNNNLTDPPSALDSLLFDGPSAPLIVDGSDEFLVS